MQLKSYLMHVGDLIQWKKAKPDHLRTAKDWSYNFQSRQNASLSETNAHMEWLWLLTEESHLTHCPLNAGTREYPHTRLCRHTWISSRIEELPSVIQVPEPHLLVEDTSKISKWYCFTSSTNSNSFPVRVRIFQLPNSSWWCFSRQCSLYLEYDYSVLCPFASPNVQQAHWWSCYDSWLLEIVTYFWNEILCLSFEHGLFV